MSLPEAAGTGSRLETLRALRDDLAVRMAECSSDQNFAVMGRLLADTLVQIDELGGGVSEVKKETALDEFTKRLAERKSAPAAPRRSAR